MDDNKPQGWPDPKPNRFPPTGLPRQGRPSAARPTPPPPPPPEITIRTMKSDMEALKQTGGAAPVPKPFTPPELAKLPSELKAPSAEKSWTSPTPPPPPKITPSDFGAPKKFEP